MIIDQTEQIEQDIARINKLRIRRVTAELRDVAAYRRAHVLRLRQEGWTMERIASLYGITRQRVKLIIGAGAALEAAGVGDEN